MLKGATTSPSLIHNELWRLLSWNWERRGWEYSPRSFGFSQMQVILGQQYLILCYRGKKDTDANESVIRHSLLT